ncbi:MAG: YceI family protein [Rickettsiales bacterium]
MRRMLLATTAAALLLVSATAHAQNVMPTPPSTDLSTLKSGLYTLDASHTSVLFNLSHLGYSNYFGRFNTVSGTLQFDARAPENSKLNITIDMNSIDTNSAKLESALKGAQWFDTGNFPTATFVSTAVEPTSATTGKVTGNLTLHGMTRPVVLDVTFNGGGQNPMMAVDALGFSATTTIQRSQFGVTQFLPMVGDTTALTISTEFHLLPPGK